MVVHNKGNGDDMDDNEEEKISSDKERKKARQP